VLEKFLKEKPLYYNEIDYSRMPRVYESLKQELKLPKIIHLVGTNGKGTTGRFLASALHSLGFSVGHYSSPHIVEFNERIWLCGANVDNTTLELAHQKLLKMLSQKDAHSLSYFEYTTLLAMVVYRDCEYLVLEAGLGGEYDATAVFANILTLITPIGRDHEAFLGNTIEKIATTKLNAIQKNAIVARQKNSEVRDVANRLAQKKALNIYELEDLLSLEDYEKISLISKKLELAPYLEENLSLSVAALKFLKIDYTVDSFENSRLFGRLTRLSENVVVDVGHNTLAAEEILKSLKGREYILVYNSYSDKNYAEILTILKPIISHIELISVEDPRIESSEIMQKTLREIGVKYSPFQTLQKEKNYLVFGSFSVVEAFLKVYNG